MARRYDHYEFVVRDHTATQSTRRAAAFDETQIRVIAADCGKDVLAVRCGQNEIGRRPALPGDGLPPRDQPARQKLLGNSQACRDTKLCLAVVAQGGQARVDLMGDIEQPVGPLGGQDTGGGQPGTRFGASDQTYAGLALQGRDTR